MSFKKKAFNLVEEIDPNSVSTPVNGEFYTGIYRNGYWIKNSSDIIKLFDPSLQRQVTTTTYTILATDNSYTIFFNSASAVTVTVDNIAIDNFTCDFYNLGAGAVTFVAGTATLGTPDGTILNTDKVCALIKFMTNNNYKLKGELV